MRRILCGLAEVFSHYTGLSWPTKPLFLLQSTSSVLGCAGRPCYLDVQRHDDQQRVDPDERRRPQTLLLHREEPVSRRRRQITRWLLLLLLFAAAGGSEKVWAVLVRDQCRGQWYLQLHRREQGRVGQSQLHPSCRHTHASQAASGKTKLSVLRNTLLLLWHKISPKNPQNMKWKHFLSKFPSLQNTLFEADSNSQISCKVILSLLFGIFKQSKAEVKSHLPIRKTISGLVHLLMY